MYLIKFTVIFEESTRALIPLVPSKDFFAVFPHQNYFFLSFLLFACITLFLSQKKRNSFRHRKPRLASQTAELRQPCSALRDPTWNKPPSHPIHPRSADVAGPVAQRHWGNPILQTPRSAQAWKVPTGSQVPSARRNLW